jgi:hypothetical protein
MLRVILSFSLIPYSLVHNSYNFAVPAIQLGWNARVLTTVDLVYTWVFFLGSCFLVEIESDLGPSSSVSRSSPDLFW